MLLFVDGFSHYTNVFMGEKWDVVSDPTDPINSGATITQSPTGVGRFGRGGVVFTNSTGGSQGNGTQIYIQKNYDGVGTIICGLALKQTNTQRAEAGGRLLTFVSGNTAQVGIYILQSGQLRVIRSAAPDLGIMTRPPFLTPVEEVVLGTSVNAISSSSFDFMEVKIVHDPVVGSVEVKRNGAAFYTLTGVNTDPAGTANSSSVCVGGFISEPSEVSVALQAVITDFYLVNTVADGADALNPVDFIGDRHWEPITETADGFYAAWTPTGSASHFANIDEVPPNTTDYNSAMTLNAKDSFDVSAPTGPATASALLALTMHIQKDTGGPFEVKGLMRLAGADRNGTAFQVPNPFAFRQSFLCSKPGGGAITLQDIIDGELGYERTA